MRQTKRRTKLRLHIGILRSTGWTAASLATASSIFLLVGCSKEEKEKDPVVTVRVTPAKRATISQTVSAEAVIYPLEQATISPKITAPITEFKVRRGDRVRKGQLLATLENKDLAGQAEASQGQFEQADAGFKTSVDATIPQQLQKAQLDADAAKAAFEAQQRVYDSRKELFQQGALPQRDLDSAAVALAQTRGAYEVHNLTRESPGLLLIPPGVWHADQNWGDDDVIIMNFPTRPFDRENPDKYRLDPHSEKIPFDWSLPDG